MKLLNDTLIRWKVEVTISWNCPILFRRGAHKFSFEESSIVVLREIIFRNKRLSSNARIALFENFVTKTRVWGNDKKRCLNDGFYPRNKIAKRAEGSRSQYLSSNLIRQLSIFVPPDRQNRSLCCTFVLVSIRREFSDAWIVNEPIASSPSYPILGLL